MAKVGRPKKDINPEQVKALAQIQCSYAEMAAVLGCDESTLTRNFAQVIKEGRESGKSSLKRKQYEVAMNGNVGMLIWLGKQHLNQSDKTEENQNIKVEEVKRIYRTAWANELAESRDVTNTSLIDESTDPKTN